MPNEIPAPPEPVVIPQTGDLGDIVKQVLQGVDVAIDNMLIAPARKVFGITEGDALDAELVQLVDDATDVIEKAAILYFTARQARRAAKK